MGNALGAIRKTVIKRYRKVGGRGANEYLHRVRAERALGKPLPPDAVVHHADGTKRDDAPLVVCQDEQYHRLLHMRMRIVRAGGNPNTQRICANCRRLKSLIDFHRSTKAGHQKYCKLCKCQKLNAWVAANRDHHLARRRQRYAQGLSA